jgi:hypothetical protein
VPVGVYKLASLSSISRIEILVESSFEVVNLWADMCRNGLHKDSEGASPICKGKSAVSDFSIFSQIYPIVYPLRSPNLSI